MKRNGEKENELQSTQRQLAGENGNQSKGPMDICNITNPKRIRYKILGKFG